MLINREDYMEKLAIFDIDFTITKKETLLLPNLTTINAKMYDIVKSLGIDEAMKKDLKVTIKDLDDVIEWEAIGALCVKFISVNYFYPDFLGKDLQCVSSLKRCNERKSRAFNGNV